MMPISATDLAIVLVYVAATLVLGIWIGRGTRTLSGFLLGGRNLPWYAVLGSIVATETSAVTFLSIPGITFADGGDFGFLQLALGFAVGRLIVVAWLMPRFFQGSFFTAYEVLNRRFGGLTQQVASLIFVLTRTLADGLRLYLTGLVLGRMTGIDISLCIALIGVATVLYAGLGGIKSVVWNDCVQLVVYLLGAGTALWVIADRLPGGWEEIISFGSATHRFQWMDLRLSLVSANLWTGLVGGAFISLATHGADQMMVQRYLSAKSERQAAIAVGLSGPAVFLQFALFLFVGLALAAFYQRAGTVQSDDPDAIFAGFIVDEMPVGLCGLTLAAVFSVAMSTLSSSLSSSASAVVNDFLKPRWQTRRDEPLEETDRAMTAVPRPPDARKKNTVEANGGETQDDVELDQRLTRASRVWTAVFGLAQVLVGVVIVHTPGLAERSVVNQVITVAAFASGLILGVFLLGSARRPFAQRSVMVGMVSGFVVTVLLISPPLESSWTVHGWWAAVISSLSTVAITWAVDLATSGQAPLLQDRRSG